MLVKQFILVVLFLSLGRCFQLKKSSLRKDERSSGRSTLRRICPSKLKLNCANVMYSKPCNRNYDCTYAGPQLVCCETGCSGDSQYVCVPEENSRCPYLPPVTYTGVRKCRVERDCEEGFTCCYNIAGEGYCHKPTADELMKTN